MAVVLGDTSTMAENTKHTKLRNQIDTDPNSNRFKSPISSLLHHFNPTTENPNSKKKNFTTATLRGMGCTASSKVSVPAVIGKSANWNVKKVKKKKVKSKKSNSKLPSDDSDAVIVTSNSISSNNPSSSCGGPKTWLNCDASSVNCVVSRRPPVAARGTPEGVEKSIHIQRENSSCNTRRVVTPEDIRFLDPGISFPMAHYRADVSGSRHYRHPRHGFHGGLAEIVLLQSSLIMEGRTERLDRYWDWRLDVDSMSYEELLELGDRIGHVSTGLREDEIDCCLRRTKLTVFENSSSEILTETERKCSICQEEYENDDETGKLNCGHFYHIHCIKQWLLQKNICPICKTAAVSEN